MLSTRKKLFVFFLLLTTALLSACAGISSPNTDQREKTEEAAEGFPNLYISEVMAKNTASFAASDGFFYDWVEICNPTDESVDLTGWLFSDGTKKNSYAFNGVSLDAGGYLVLFCSREAPGGTGFALSEGETATLLAPDGTVMSEVGCISIEENVSLCVSIDGDVSRCIWPTPGCPNTKEAYDYLCGWYTLESPLVIQEAAVSNGSFHAPGDSADECSDWVEIRNLSDQAIDLTGCTLSNRDEEGSRWNFPEKVLGPGKTIMVRCNGEVPADENNTGFSLSATGENLFLRDREGKLLDYVNLHDVPIGGSMGRKEGENGFFYFSKATPGTANGYGCRRVSAQPVPQEPDGAYNGVDAVSVTLSAEGRIYYTTDCSVPNAYSAQYSLPLTLDHTGVIRAIAVEEGALPSVVATYTYFVNENHTLPLLSLVTDDAEQFAVIYRKAQKYVSVPSHLALYDTPENSFHHACMVSLQGWTSLSLPKKGMSVEFDSRSGGNLRCDVFGNGIDRYASLSIRAGQDYPFAIFRNELFQDLAREASDVIYAQESKYCILYINGAYYGIYCLKEDYSRQYFASHAGVSKASVEMLSSPIDTHNGIYEMYTFCISHKMWKDENVETVGQVIDLDSLIDWILLECYCGNTDTTNNVKYFRSAEDNGLWKYAFYDLDWGFWYTGTGYSMFMKGEGNTNIYASILIRTMIRNPAFQEHIVARFAELNQSVLSNEHVLEKIDAYEQLLLPEAGRDRVRWGMKLESWQEHVQGLRDTIIKYNWEKRNQIQFIDAFDISTELQQKYFS